MGDGRHHGEIGAASLFHSLGKGLQLLVGGQIALVARHDHGPGGQLGVEGLQLPVDDVEILQGIPALASRHVYHVDQHPAPFHVPQELMAQAHALAGPLDHAGDVGHNEGDPFLHANHTQHRGDGGEGVVGDFRLGLADDGNQGGFSHIGEAHQPHVGQQL